MTDITGNLDTAMEQVSAWKADQFAAIAGELVKLEDALGDLRQAIANLTEQQHALEQRKAELSARQEQLDDEADAKAHEALFAGIIAQRAEVAARAAEVAELEAEHQTQLSDSFDDPAVAQLKQEYDTFVTEMAPKLDLLPESYRAVVESHHAEVERKLNEALAAIDHTPPTLEAQAIGCDVLLSVDPEEGPAEVVTLVLPVGPELHEDWGSRDEDLETRLALRTVQVLYEVCRNHGLNAVEAMFGGHQGLLAIEVDVTSAAVSGLGEALKQALDTCYETAPELLRARLGATARLISPDHLYPPEDEELEELAAEELSDA